MKDLKKLVVELPQSLVQEIDYFVENNGERDNFIKEAAKLYIYKKKRQKIRENLRNGYIEMRDINLQLADEGLSSEYRTICYYEQGLAKCD